MVTIGNDTLPGLITTVESGESGGANIGAPGTPVIVGQAYLAEGSADADTMYRVTRRSRAENLFGPVDKSMLTRAIAGALVEGAYPVFAIAAPETEAQNVDLSGETGQSMTLSNTPIVEVADDVTLSVNSVTKDVSMYTKGDPENASVGTDEALLNPQTGKLYVDESLGNTGDEITYTYVDYANTFDEIENAVFSDQYVREVIDFIVPVDENDTVVTDAKDKSEAMEGEGWFNIAVAGAGEPYIVDAGVPGTDETSSYTNSYDTSRLQLVYPTRDADGNTIIGEYIGRRSAIGIDNFAIFKRISSVTDLQTSLSRTQRENLVGEFINPLEELQSGVRIVEDYTTVTDTNDEESAWRRGYSRLLTDFVVESANARAEPFIGDFNSDGVLGTLKSNVSTDLRALISSGQIDAYSLVVEAEDATTVILDIGMDPADPIRNIEITVTAGDITNGVTSTSGGE